jgi:hypothetical protein
MQKIVYSRSTPGQLSRLERELPESDNQRRKRSYMNWTIQEGCDVCGCNRCAFRMNADGIVHRLCNDSDLLEMVTSYTEAALWSSTDGNEDVALDENYGVDDIDNAAYAEMISDCESFRDSHADMLSDVSPSDAGHNFWLSRNGHGAGFFDSSAEHAHALQAATRPYGSVDLYVHEGRVHSN